MWFFKFKSHSHAFYQQPRDLKEYQFRVKLKNMPCTTSLFFAFCSRKNFKTLTSVNPWALGPAITAVSVDRKKRHIRFIRIWSHPATATFSFHSVEISDSASKEDVEVAVLTQTLSLSAVFSLARFFRSSALTENLAQARQNTETKWCWMLIII